MKMFEAARPFIFQTNANFTTTRVCRISTSAGARYFCSCALIAAAKCATPAPLRITESDTFLPHQVQLLYDRIKSSALDEPLKTQDHQKPDTPTLNF